MKVDGMVISLFLMVVGSSLPLLFVNVFFFYQVLSFFVFPWCKIQNPSMIIQKNSTASYSKITLFQIMLTTR